MWSTHPDGKGATRQFRPDSELAAVQTAGRRAATAAVARADLILSWNFKHIVNYDRVHKYNGVNALNGYQAIEIHSPLELIYGDEDEDI